MSENPSYYIEDSLPGLDFSEGVHYDNNGDMIKNKGVIYDSFVCVRPKVRQEIPKVNVSISDSKQIILNNYGHGGIGWSLLWGSAIRSYSLLQSRLLLQQ